MEFALKSASQIPKGISLASKATRFKISTVAVGGKKLSVMRFVSSKCKYVVVMIAHKEPKFEGSSLGKGKEII